ncbi:MAG: hypothetical protein J6Q47_02180 [Paludibacteraceae bacterium]|nr:hypothetical protein [Paludibacteraceae bacterium]
MNDNIIVAIDLGSSRLVAAAAQKKENSETFQIIDLCEKFTPKNCIRRGIICNIDKIADEVSTLLKKLQTSVNDKLGENIIIKSFYYAVGGHSLRSENLSKNVILKSIISANTIKEIKNQILNDLKNQNIVQELQTSEGLFDSAQLDDSEKISILHKLITKNYNLDGNELSDVIGQKGDILKINYLVVKSKLNLQEKLNKLFEKTKNYSAIKNTALLAMAKTYLSEAEKNNNCLLIDFGANCTSCIAFESGKLKDLFVIPFGSQSITNDICNIYSLPEEKGEFFKMNLSLTSNDSWKAKTSEMSISRKQIENVTMGRLMEILQLIKSRIGDIELNGGIVLTGGGSKLRCFADLLQIKLLAEVRNISYDNFTASEFAKPENALILSLLSNGEQNCCEQKEIKTKDKKKEKNLNNVWNKFGNMFND